MAKSLAVAYSMKKKKKASGGTVKSGDAEMNYSEGGDTLRDYKRNRKEKLSKETVAGERRNRIEAKKIDRESTHGVHPAIDPSQPGTSASRVYGSITGKEKEYHKSNLSRLKSMKGPTSGKSGFAEGGEVDDGGAPAWVCSNCGHHGQTFSGHQDGSHALDMIESILAKRRMACGGMTERPSDVGGSPKYSHGGEIADFDPNEFDYLETEAGEEAEEEGKDLVSRAMSKRKAKKK